MASFKEYITEASDISPAEADRQYGKLSIIKFRVVDKGRVIFSGKKGKIEIAAEFSKTPNRNIFVDTNGASSIGSVKFWDKIEIIDNGRTVFTK